MTPHVQTCNKPYDRHTYVIVTKNGKEFKYDDYEQMRYGWFTNSPLKKLSHVLVKDVA